MKIEGVIINDKSGNKYFAFVKQFPGVCAQANSIADVQIKLDAHFASFIDRMTKERVEFSNDEITTF